MPDTANVNNSGTSPVKGTGGEKPVAPTKIDREAAAKRFQTLMTQPKEAEAMAGQQVVPLQQQKVQTSGTIVESAQTVGGDQKVGEQAKPPLLDYNDLVSFFNTPKQEVKPEGSELDIEELNVAPTDPDEIKRMKAGMNKHFTQTNQKNAELRKKLESDIEQYKAAYVSMSQQIGELKGMLTAFQMGAPGGQPGFTGQVPGQDVQGNYNFNPDASFTETQGIDPALASRLAILEKNNQEILAYREAQERQQSIGKVRSYYQTLVKDDPILSTAGEEVEGFIISAAIAGRTPLVDAIQAFRQNMRGLTGGSQEAVRRFILNSPDSDLILREALAIAQEKYTGAKNNAAINLLPGESVTGPALGSVKQETSGRLTAEGARLGAAKLWSALTGKGAQA